MERRAGGGAGCLVPVGLLVLGIVIGVVGTISFLGLSLGQLFGRTNSQGGPPVAIVTVGPTAEPPRAIQDGYAPGRRLVWQAPIVLDSDTQEPDLLVVSRNYDKDADTLLYFSPDDGAVRWESASLGENGNAWVIAYGRDTVLVADKSRLMALSRSNGSTLWEAAMSDEIAYSICADCLQVFGDAVVALSGDGVLQAYNIASGAPLWSVRLRESPRQLVNVGGLAGVPDQMPNENVDIALYLFNPSDGTRAREIAPACQEENGNLQRPGIYDPILHDPAGKSLYWMISSYEPCLVRIDTASREQSWQVSLPNYNDIWLSSDDPIFVGETMYLADEDRLYAIDGQGKARLVLSEEDYDIKPMAASDDAILLRATRTRGSSRQEIWAIDAQSGDRRWERVLIAGDPIESPRDSGDWAATIRGDAVALVERRQEQQEIGYELIGLRDGVSRAKTILQVEDPTNSLRGATWGAGTAWLAINELYGVELSSGKTLYRWPE